jgi:hypothetical protein
VFGWKGDALQRAMDNFCHQDCPTLKTQSYDDANKCTKAAVVGEEIDGCKLPFLQLPTKVWRKSMGFFGFGGNQADIATGLPSIPGMSS